MTGRGLAYFIMGFLLMGIFQMLTTFSITKVELTTPKSTLEAVR